MRRRSRRHVRAPLSCAALFLLTAAVSATSVIAPTFNELVDGSREIFVGKTLSRSSQWVDTRDGRAIVTLITFAVEESLKRGSTNADLECMPRPQLERHGFRRAFDELSHAVVEGP